MIESQKQRKKIKNKNTKNIFVYLKNPNPKSPQPRLGLLANFWNSEKINKPKKQNKPKLIHTLPGRAQILHLSIL